MQDICSPSSGPRLAYFYFDFQNLATHNEETMLRSLIRQLSATDVEVPESVQTLYAKLSDKGLSPTYEDLCTSFLSIVQASVHDCYIMLDALDEVPEESRCEILELLQDATTRHFGKLRILVTSRYEMDIRNAITQMPHATVHLGEEDVDTDIQTYVRSCLAEPKERLSGLSDALKSEIERKVGIDARGM
jgi:hypothetical protein